MLIREYQPSDCIRLTELFYDTVHAVCAKDYAKEQCDAWATGTVDPEAWDLSFRAHTTLVAVERGRIVGFGDITETGYLDRLFVDQEHQRGGIATAICDTLERTVSGRRITTHASITAKPFFEKRGYRVVKAQKVAREGVFLTNYVMEKQVRMEQP